MKKKFSQIVVSAWKKIALVLLGIFFFLVLLEAGLRLGGFVLCSIQEYGNLRSIKQKGTYRILCLGESTTQGQYPHLLEQVLNRRNIGVRFSVIDKGRAGANTLFILNQVESYLAEYRPDMVVTMMGINEKNVRYYRDIPESDTWLFRHCRVYRFGRILYLHILKKIKHEDIYGFNKREAIYRFDRADPGRKAKLEDRGIALKNANLTDGPSAEKVAKSDFVDRERSPGPGSSSLTRSMLSEAEESLKKTDPQNNNAYFELGRFYQEQGEFLQAENSFKKAIEINPGNDNVYVELGELYRFQGKFLQAEDLFKKAIQLNPENDQAFYKLGWLYRNLSKFPQAEDSFKKAVELDPKNDENQVLLGGIYHDQGKFSQAEDSFRKTIELNPRNERAFLELGEIYRDQGKFSQAEDCFKKALALSPQHERVMGAMASLYEDMGKPELAKGYAEKANRWRFEHCVPDTVNNYRKLKEILDRKGIKLVCVQYPVRSVESLKKIFKKDEGVIFVDNERVFKEALKKSGYREYFRDMFGGDFGHCTQKGNMLLAQNIANVILREVFNT